MDLDTEVGTEVATRPMLLCVTFCPLINCSKTGKILAVKGLNYQKVWKFFFTIFIFLFKSNLQITLKYFKGCVRLRSVWVCFFLVPCSPSAENVIFLIINSLRRAIFKRLRKGRGGGVNKRGRFSILNFKRTERLLED